MRSGISGAASKAFNLAADNRQALLMGAAAGGLAAAVKATADKARYEQQAIRSAAYKSTLAGIANFAAQGAAATNPASRQAILKLARGRLNDLGEIGYRGLEGGLQQKLQQQHQVVAGWLERANAVERESGPTRAFVLGAAQAGTFGMKQFATPTLSPPSTRAALTTGLLIGAATTTGTAALALARRRQQQQAGNVSNGSAIKLQPVRNSSLATAIGYDERQKTLALTFKSNGQTYLYRQVPPAVANQLLASERKGQLFHRHIRGKYETVRLGRSALKAAKGS
jgi:hypothetical protein